MKGTAGIRDSVPTTLANMAPGFRKSLGWLRAGALLIASGCPSAAVAASTPILPNGTYDYVIAERGKDVGKSEIVVTRVGNVLMIDEHASPMEATEKTRWVLDATTFATLSYADTSDGREVMAVTIGERVATLKQGGVTTRIMALPNAPFVVSDLNVGLFFQLPATLHAADTKHLTMASLGFSEFKALPLAASAEGAPRPKNVPLRDAALTVTVEHGTAILWYDPQTFVLDQCDVPAIQFVFRRTAHHASPSK